MSMSDRAIRTTYFAGILRWISTVAAQGAGLAHRLRRRRRLYRMLGLDDHMLDDIGITREDLLWAIDLPLRVNAALLMHARARCRRAMEAKGRGGGMANALPSPDRSPVSDMAISGMVTHGLRHPRSDIERDFGDRRSERRHPASACRGLS